MAPTKTAHLIENLRQLMRNPAFVPKVIEAYIVPSDDAHQSEYTAACDDRRAFITGFTGSAGTAVVTSAASALWTDGRYYLQARQQMEDQWMLMKMGQPETPKLSQWLLNHFVSQGLKECSVGADPLVLDRKEWKDLEKELSSGGHNLVAVEKNLIDFVWGDDRPAIPNEPLVVLEDCWTGSSVQNKLSVVRTKISAKRCSAIVLTALDDVAYLYNLRGSDIPYNPVFFAYALVTTSEAHLFVSPDKLTPAVSEHLKEGGVTVHPYDNIFTQLKKECDSLQPGELFWLPTKCSQAVAQTVPPHSQYVECTPVALAKAIKNDTEICGMEACHVRDGAAVCRFLAWLEVEAPKRSQTEMSAADYLEKCRSEQKHFRGLSFPSISSVGANAAIVHYQTCPETNATISDSEVYLIDSGGHYSDGTTDVTRTVHFGTPSDFEKECFTRVLKGHIMMATAVFPNKILGNCLDSFARYSLWSVGLNYGHGTGHGVGMFLNVHEGPMGISWRQYPEDPGLQEGMFVSDEPGYYKDGEFGIRIESIVRIVKAKTPYKHDNQDFLTFKATTLVPIQAGFIELSLLTDSELSWLNAYHSRVRAEVGPLLLEQQDTPAHAWLLRHTEPITRPAAAV